LLRQQRLVARQRDQRREMRTGGIADQRDTVWVDAQLRGIGADELHRRLHVRSGARPSAHPRLHQPVFDREQGVAAAREVRAPVLVDVTVADLPAAAMHRDQHRCLVEPARIMQIAKQLDAVMHRKQDVGFDAGFVRRHAALR
jgi:hypothetical protein